SPRCCGLMSWEPAAIHRTFAATAGPWKTYRGMMSQVPTGFSVESMPATLLRKWRVRCAAVPESAFDCLQKPNGNMPLVAGRAGLRDLSSAAATILKRLAGMTGTVAGHVSQVFGSGDLVPII